MRPVGQSVRAQHLGSIGGIDAHDAGEVRLAGNPIDLVLQSFHRGTVASRGTVHGHAFRRVI